MTTAVEPAWLRHARSLIGTREAAGAANSPTIMGWAKKLGTKGLGMVYNADSVPWCRQAGDDEANRWHSVVEQRGMTLVSNDPPSTETPT